MNYLRAEYSPALFSTYKLLIILTILTSLVER
jgi:hypothetical protein